MTVIKDTLVIAGVIALAVTLSFGIMGVVLSIMQWDISIFESLWGDIKSLDNPTLRIGFASYLLVSVLTSTVMNIARRS